MKRMILIILACLMLCACTAQTVCPPPESILYLGGAPILDQFKIEGGPGTGFNNTDLDIVIWIPGNFMNECFHAVCVGVYEDGTQDTVFTEAELTPNGYFGIGKEIYGKYTQLTLYLDYSWNGTLMSQRIVDLLTGEEHSSVTKEFGISK